MKKLIIIKEPVFKSAAHLFWGYSFDELRAFLAKNEMELEDEYKGSLGLTFCNLDNSGVNYHSIWLKSSEWTLKTQAIFAHELAHLIFDIYKTKGIEIHEEDSNETYCYLYEYYFYHFCVHIQKLVDREQKKPKRKIIANVKKQV